jgi:hypothetical protein
VQKLILVQGDMAPVPQAVLTDTAGGPLNLADASVRFRMTNYHTGINAVDAQATVVQDNDNPETWGQVAYFWQSPDTAAAGLYQAWFIVDWGNGPSHFPPDGEWFILIKPRR